MPTQLAAIVFDDLPEGFFPTPPTDWTIPTADKGRILNGNFTRNSTVPCSMRYNIPFATNEIQVGVAIPAAANAGISGGQLLDASNDGYYLSVTISGLNAVIAVYLCVDFMHTTQLFTQSIVQAGNTDKIAYLSRNRTTGLMSVYLNTTQLGSSFINTTYDPTFGSATISVNTGSVRSIILTDLSENLVTSFNGANDIERGQQNVAYSTSGFSSITAITTNTAGVTVSGISDTSGDGDCDFSDYVNDGLYPALPATVIYTFGDGTNTAQITKTLTIKSTESAATTSGMISINDSYLGYHFQAAGRSIADGGQIVWPTTTDLIINADGSYSYSPGGTLELTLWYRDPSNGRVYEFNVTFGGSSGGGGNGITMAGITAAGITMTGITMVGL